MAADTRPFKSKEQDGQGNEVIIRDQQLVEQASQTTMASGEYFEIVDVDGRMAKIPKANMMSVVLEAIRLLLDDSGSNISAANLTKILGLSASSIGNILPADLASVLGDTNYFTKAYYEGVYTKMICRPYNGSADVRFQFVWDSAGKKLMLQGWPGGNIYDIQITPRT